MVVSPAQAQPDPWPGTYRGQLLSPERSRTNVTLTIVTAEDGYAGVITGFGAGIEIRLRVVRASEMTLTVEGASESEFGPLTFAYDLTRTDDTVSGEGRVTLGAHGFGVSLELERARRTDVIQPQVEQRIGYFSGEWAFSYTGGEFPPLSIGTRAGTVRFSPLADGPFVHAGVNGKVFGETYAEIWTIGFDADTETVVWQEELSDGQTLLSLGNWTSPIGITFLTAPVEAEGRVLCPEANDTRHLGQLVLGHRRVLDRRRALPSSRRRLVSARELTDQRERTRNLHDCAGGSQRARYFSSPLASASSRRAPRKMPPRE